MERETGMKIIYRDGSILVCNMVWFEGDNIIADDIYTIPIEDVLRIESKEV